MNIRVTWAIVVKWQLILVVEMFWLGDDFDRYVDEIACDTPQNVELRYD